MSNDTEPTPEPKAKKANARRGKKKTSKKKHAASALVGCSLFGERGCDAERIHEWARARDEVRGLLRAGRITLCDRHKTCLDGPQPKEEDDDKSTGDD